MLHFRLPAFVARLAGAGALVAAAAAMPEAAFAAALPDLAPHRAVYELKLNEASDRSGIAGVDGRIVFDTSGSRCEGYTVTFRLVMRIFDVKGTAQLTDLQTSSFESPDGFDFTVRTFANGSETENTRGRAVHGEEETRVTLTRPESKTLAVGADVLFPSEHMNRILAKARAGERLLQADIYDGSEGGEQVFPTLTVIGAPVRESSEVGAPAGSPDLSDGLYERGRDDAEAVAAIGEGPAWPVTVSYYSSDGRMEESEPVYEISFLLHDNGVSRRLRLDYGEFSVDGGLSEIEFFDEPEPCAAGE